MNPKQIGIGLLVVAIVAVAVMQFNNTGNNTENGSDTSMQTSETTGNSTAAGTNAATSDMADPNGSMMESTYTNGTYEATGNYTSPAQQEEVDIVITLADGVVVDAQFEGKATNATSQKLQGMFSEGFKEEVIGKNIDDINLTVVNGSSLTPKGFMDALQKVKEEASV